MKKTVLSVLKKAMMVALLLTGGGIFSNVYGQQQIPMQIIDESASSDGPTYAPPRPWYITEYNYVLTLPAFEDDYTLELRDEDDVVVYSAFVPAGTTQVVLPSTLSGDFEIRLVGDTYYYRGYIEL
jgi:hypothetical protein